MATRGTKDYYQILSVGEGADAAEIKKAYRRLAKENHPDANPGDPTSADRFKEVGEAYSVLSDAAKRKQYDQMRKYGAMGGFGFGGAPGGRSGTGFSGGFSTGFGSPTTGPGGEQRFTFEDLGDLGGLGDIFSSIFNRGGKREKGPPGAAGQARGRGRDVEYVVEIPFTTAARGGKITINVPMTDDCATCTGTGSKPGSKPRACPECSGTGTISFGKGGFAVNRPCPACLGRGEVPTAPCTVCGGSGQVRENRQIALTVPAGVDNGSKLRLSGQGEKGAGGAAAGDLLVTFKVKPHHFFRREGLDIHCTIPINFAQATLGSKVRVKTVDGRKVALRIPIGTQSGTRFRVAGQGIEKAGRRGDQYVQVKVQVPEQLSEEEERRMRDFAAAAGMKH